VADQLRARVLERLAPTTGLARAGRIALLLVLSWFSLRHLGDPAFQGIYGGLNLALHEAGHLVFQWFGSAGLAAAGGTLFHLICVGAVGVAFWRQRDPFAVSVAIWWSGTVFVGAGHYAADARRQVLPLVTVGDGPAGHDWYTILEGIGLLAWDQQVGGVLRGSGLALLVTGVAAGAWTVWLRPRGAARSDAGVDLNDRGGSG
jgi:hypothetical protein